MTHADDRPPRSIMQRDVKMQHVFARAKPGVKRNGRIITVVGLDEYDIGAVRGTNASQFIDQRDGDPLTAVCFRHRKIVDVRFGPARIFPVHRPQVRR